MFVCLAASQYAFRLDTPSLPKLLSDLASVASALSLVFDLPPSVPLSLRSFIFFSLPSLPRRSAPVELVVPSKFGFGARQPCTASSAERRVEQVAAR